MVIPSPLTCWGTQSTAKLWSYYVHVTGQESKIQGTPSSLTYELGLLAKKKRKSIRRFGGSPGVSVLMPTYKHSAYIRRAINSVLRQTFENWELIIVNDNSPDDTDKQVATFLKDKRIRYFKNRETVGEWASVLEALKFSRGKYIAYLHSDDIWYPNHLQIMYDYLESHPDKYIVYTAFHGGGRYAKHLELSVPAGKAFENIPAEQDITGREKELIQYGNFMIPIQVMHRRECLERHRPPTRAEDEQEGRPHTNPDGRLWAKFLKDYNIGFINVPTAQWVIHGENSHLNEASSMG